MKKLMLDIERNGLDCCLGKPEKLKHQLTGMYSRRINKKDRLVYQKVGDCVRLISLRDHY
ncbi:type II toxin-antitoxin system YoeB family toxin [Flammeovirga yaeyamensis]|uniref:type II toxin-antitoxin system YoeB family toxin n=1 Tax=Flammeovirga yaeyamensis TaxID=367791 RepID=UPI0037C14239